MNISIIGTGYVGLVSGACLADLGNTVTCIDTNKTKIQNIKKLELPFYEPSLQEIVERNVQEGRLFFESNYTNISSSEIIFLCIDTPKGISGKPNLINFNKAIDSIIDNINTSVVIATKSTVPLGTNKEIIAKLREKLKRSKDIAVEVCSNPEFLKEGSAVNDFLRPERIIVGAQSESVFDLMTTLYMPLNRKSNRLIKMSIESAEITKYAANAFLATKISFINQIAKISEKVGGNIHEIRHGIGSDSRIGKDFLYAGLGFGGSCFPKDIQALIEIEKSLDLDASLLEAVIKINHDQVNFFINKIIEIYRGNLHTKSILVWGMSFKPNTDDIRESVAIDFLAKIQGKVKKVYVYDPVVKSLPEKLKKLNIIKLESQYQHIEDCDALVLCTEWKQFWNPNLQLLDRLKDKFIFDGRNVLDADILEKNNFKYLGIGLNTSLNK